jgi:hypothetical protein
MAWKGVEADRHVWWASGPDSNNFESPRHDDRFLTSGKPAVAVFNGRLFMAWQGIDNDHLLWWASSSDGVNFDGPNNHGTQTQSSMKSSFGPALAVFKGRLFMAWNFDSPGFTGPSGGSLSLASSSDGLQFEELSTPYSLVLEPALAVFNDRLFMAFIVEGQHLNWASSHDPDKPWGGYGQDPAINGSGAPALTVF